MKKIKTLILLIITLLCASIEAKEYKVDEIPIVHLQNKTRYVSNPDNILSESSVMEIDTTLYSLEQSTGIQALVVVVSGIEGGDCFDFAHQLGEKNGIGEKKRDNGIVVLLSTDERCIQIATGYGIEGALPDALCKRIQSKYMLPYFKDNEWDKGMVAGIKAIKGYLDGSMQKEDVEEDDDITIILTIITIFVFIIIGALFTVWWKRRCPVCKKHNIQRVSSNVISIKNGIKVEAVTYKCLNCGHIFIRNEESVQDNDNNEGTHMGGGTRFGGVGGFGSGGGGFSGGCYGGGSFGGGGAGSRF